VELGQVEGQRSHRVPILLLGCGIWGRVAGAGAASTRLAPAHDIVLRARRFGVAIPERDPEPMTDSDQTRSALPSTPAAVTAGPPVYPAVAVIVLNWNRRDDTLACVDSLYATGYPALDVIVVDNGSADDSVPAIRAHFPQAALLQTGRNLGYAGGNNIGLEAALGRGPEFVLVLNNDTVVAHDAIHELVACAAQHPEAGALSPIIYRLGDRDRIWYAGARWLADASIFEHGEWRRDGNWHEAIVEAEYASGCAMFIRTSALRQIGLLDLRFFLLFEDIDWCFRCRAEGYRCLMTPRAVVWHRISASFGGGYVPLYRYFYTRNRLLWAEKHLSARGRLGVAGATVCDILAGRFGLALLLLGRGRVRQAYWEARSAMRQPAQAQRAALRGALDYVLRRFGDCPVWLRASR
jgi:GT2 family glycosyltransferase